MSGSPRLTKNGKTIVCKTDIFVPLVVPGLSVNSGSSSLLQESSGPDAHLVSGNRAASSSSSDSVLERNDELATRRLGQESRRDDKKDADDPLADLPFWLQEFKDNLEPKASCRRRTGEALYLVQKSLVT